MQPTKEWKAQWEKSRLSLRCSNDLNEYFSATSIAGQKLDRLALGTVTVPTGNLIVLDPLCYVTRDAAPYFQAIPVGEYPVEAAVIMPDETDCARYAAVRVKVTEQDAIYWEEALIGNENLEDFEPGMYYGFYVDAGLGSVMDQAGKDAFCDFMEQWQRKNPNENLYDGYFAELFSLNYEANPKYQRPGGDWINWTVPGTTHQIPMFQSGFGDGCYPVYFGYDARGAICSIVIQFIDIALAYGAED